MKLLDKNLNLLLILDAIMRLQNLTQAAEELGMSQPNLSRALKILRAELKDPLFVRGPNGVIPTERARQLAPIVKNALATVAQVYQAREFDPKEAQGRFTIATSDYIEFLLASKLASVVCKEAPNLTLNFRPGLGRLPKEELESGDYDLSIFVSREPLPPGFIIQDLFLDPYVSVVRKSHPLLKKKITKDSFLTYGHVLISPQGHLWAAVDEQLSALNEKRRLVLGTPNALSAAVAVSQSDLILTASLRFVEGVAKIFQLEYFKTPFDIPPIRCIQTWHERSHQDPLHAWIRNKIKSLL